MRSDPEWYGSDISAIRAGVTEAIIPRHEDFPHAEMSAVPEEEISLVDVFRWIGSWWWLAVGGGLAGLLIGLGWHLATDPRFVVRLDMSITDTPLGPAPLVRNIATGVLEEEIGATIAVAWDDKRGTLGLIKKDAPQDQVVAQQIAMRDAAAALEIFLDRHLAREYSEMQVSFAAMPPSPEAYAALARFRLHLTALEEGWLQSVVVVSQSTTQQSLSLTVLLAAGGLIGLMAAGLIALIVDLWRGRIKFSGQMQ